MKTIYINKNKLILILSIFLTGCTETYNLKTETFEEALVVEATLTNEVKKQEIKISRTAQFEEEGRKLENGANVIISDNKGHSFVFNEQEGKYISENEFGAQPDTEYSLEISTTDGKKYESTAEVLTTQTEIQDIVPKVVLDSKQGRGVRINVKSYDPTSTSKYYRYEYEETYKIITPNWTLDKLVVVGPQQIELVPNSADTKVCYSTNNSIDIIQTTTTNLKEDRVDFPVRFISDQNYIISHRYSILVKQYVQNFQSYSFYKTLNEIASSSSLLSPKQPGFLNGNIKCTTNTDSKVIGFFDVSSVSSKRMFFNYVDLFPGEKLPPYVADCSEIYYNYCFGFSDPACQGRDLINAVSSESVSYLYNELNDYYMVVIPCGDCTTFSSNEIPSFWIN